MQDVIQSLILQNTIRDVNMTPASARTMRSACVLPCPLIQEPVLSKGLYWVAGGKVSALMKCLPAQEIKSSSTILQCASKLVVPLLMVKSTACRTLLLWMAVAAQIIHTWIRVGQECCE